MKEIFKPIKAYPSYEISNLANVVSTKQGSKKYLKKFFNQLTGKMMVHLYDDNKKVFNAPVYKLMSEYFPEIVYKEAGAKNYTTVDNPNRGASKLNSFSAHAIKWFLEKGVSVTELAKAFNISYKNISDIKHNKIWRNVKLVN